MKLEDIKEIAKKDLIIDDTLLDDETLRSVTLLGKWSEILHEEELHYLKYDREFKSELRFKLKYYKGKCTRTELKEKNLSQFLENLNNTDLNRYLESDNELSELKLKADFQKKKIELIRNYMDAIKQRTWSIKNAIEYRKFIGGS